MNRYLAMMLIVLVWTGAAIAAGVADQVQVQSPYVRAVPPGQPNSAAFMALTNTDAAAHRLLGAASPAAEAVELHTHTNDGGVMRMRRIDGIDLPAGAVTTLQPGGLHVMLIGLRQPLADGQLIDLTLQFEDGSERVLQVPVENAVMRMKCGAGKCGAAMGGAGAEPRKCGAAGKCGGNNKCGSSKCGSTGKCGGR